MAIKLPDGKIARTLPEQVKKNMDDIVAIDSEIEVIKESISTAYKIQGSATVADLNDETIEESMNGYVYNMTDAGSLNNDDGTTTSVQIGDNVVLVWNEGDYFWDRLSGMVDTSNLVTLDTEQTITGKKTFKNDNLYLQKADESKSYYIEWVTVSGSPGLNFRSSSMAVGQYTIRLQDYSLFTYSVKPTASGGYDLGQSSLKYRDIYLSGAVKLRNSSATIDAEITQSQYGSIDFRINNNSAFLMEPGITYGRGHFATTGTNKNLGTASLLWYDLYLSHNLTDGTNSVSVAQLVKKTQLYKHAVLIGGLLNAEIILNSDTSLVGLVGTVLAGKQVISAYLTGLYMLYVDGSFNLGHFASGAWTTDINATDTITADTVSEY